MMPAIIQLYLMELLTPDMRSVLGATLMINVRYVSFLGIKSYDSF